MITLQPADLVVIAARVLGEDTGELLDLLDAQAAQETLAEVSRLSPGGQDPARLGAALLHGLLRRPVFPRSGEQIALMATAQLLGLNGFDLDLDPPEETAQVIADVVAGRLGPDELAGWLTPRLRARPYVGLPAEELCERAPMLLRWLPSRKRRAKDPFHRFTDRARVVIVLAQEEARRLGHNYVGTEHVLLGLIAHEGGIAAKALQVLGVGSAEVRRRIESIVGRGHGAVAGHIPFTPRAKKAIEACALREAMQLGHNYIGTEHLLLGLLREGDGLAAQVLVALGADHTAVRDQVMRLLHGRAGVPEATVPGLARLDASLGQIRRAKEAAIDAGEFDTAAALRDTEKRLLIERQRQIGQWTDGGNLLTSLEENLRLRAEVERLRGLLRHHGIDPDEGPPQAAHA